MCDLHQMEFTFISQKKRKECKNYKVSLDGDREMRIADKKGKQMQNKITKKSREEVCGNFQRHFSQ
jgi:hypothetical protein